MRGKPPGSLGPTRAMRSREVLDRAGAIGLRVEAESAGRLRLHEIMRLNRSTNTSNSKRPLVAA
jgi:hypothetical protein